MTNILKPADQVRRTAVLLGLLCVCVFVAPVAADAAGPRSDSAKGKSTSVRGRVVAKSTTTVTVCVGTARRSTSKHAGALRGKAVVFDVRAARLIVSGPANARVHSLDAIRLGARADVRARIASGAVGPFAASKLRVANQSRYKHTHGFDGGVCPSETPTGTVVEEQPRNNAPIES